MSNKKNFDPWIGVDLDGCLAEYSGWVDEFHIGRPVDAMVQRIRKWLADGREVKVLTPRVTLFLGNAEPAPADSLYPESRMEATPDAVRGCIRDWCEKHIGCTLDVVVEVNPGMTEWWSSRCVQVERNTGKRLYVHKEYTLS